MHFSPRFGIAAAELGWVPAPRYLLRRAALLDLIGNDSPGAVLEIGCGAGALLYDLAQAGFYGIGVEQSPQACAVATQVLAGTPAFQVVSQLPEEKVMRYDYVMAFEVLEHIADDQAALCSWVQYLKPAGTLLISVPAHQKRWDQSDVWAGHYRRHERAELVAKIERAGCIVVTVYNYGWPLANWIEPVRSWVYGRRLQREARQHPQQKPDQLTQTFRSGVERTAEVRLYPLYANWIGSRIFSSFFWLQRRFFATDWGTGYLVLARKRQSEDSLPEGTREGEP